MLTKRTPGAPLSEAELQQRRDAARSRWEGAAALAGGASGGAAGAALAGEARRRLDRMKASEALRAGREEAANIKGRALSRAGRIQAAGKKQADLAVAGDAAPKYRRFLDRRLRETERDLRAVNTGQGVAPPIYRNRASVLLGSTDLADEDVVPSGRDLWSDALEQRRKAMGETRAKLAGVGKQERVKVSGFVRPGAKPHTRIVRGEVTAADAAIMDAVQPLAPLAPGTIHDVGDETPKVMTPAERARRQKLRQANAALRRAKGMNAGPVDISTLKPKTQASIQKAKMLVEAAEEAVAEGDTSWATDRRMKGRLTQARNLLAEYGLAQVEATAERGESAGKVGKPAKVMSVKPVRVSQGSASKVEPFTRKKPRLWPTKDDQTTWRKEMRADALDRAEMMSNRAIRRAVPKVRAAGAQGMGNARRIVSSIPMATRRARITGAAAGVGLGALAAYLAARRKPEGSMEKAAPLTKAAPRATADLLANRLGALFRAWTDNPAQAGDRESVAEAIEPASNLFLDAGDRIIQPPGGDSTQSAPTGPDPRYLINGAFDARNPRVEQLLERYSFDLIRNITDQSREAVRTAMQLGAMTGATIPEQARLIRQSVGLSPGQVAWVSSYRKQLETLDARALGRELRDGRYDKPIRRAIETGKPLSEDQVARMVDAYHRRTLAYRATTIARTEGIRAANMGSLAQVKAMLEADPTLTVEKTWIATKDGRERSTHHKLDGQVVVGLDTPFMVQDDQGMTVAIRYPHDEMAAASETVNCRCTMGFRVVRATERRALVAEAV